MFIDTKVRCFMEAARCLNFTRAAENLYISQPALSKNIAALESECGMKLFFRDTRHNGVKLTPAGAVLLCEFQKVEEILDGVIDKAQRAASGQEGKLTIGLLFGQILNRITAQVMLQIDENYPKIEINKIQGSFRDLRQWLQDGMTDTIITYEEEVCQMRDIMYEEVQKVQLGFALQPYHPLSGKRVMRIRDLEGQKVILNDEKDSAVLADRFRMLCAENGIRVKEVIGRDLSHCNMMAEMGKGILVTSEDSIVTRSPNLKFYKSDELGSIRLVAAWRKDNLNPIITFYHQMYEEMYRSGENK